MYLCENAAPESFVTKLINTKMIEAVMEMTLTFICFSKSNISDSEYEKYENSINELLNKPESIQFIDKHEKQIKSGMQTEIDEKHGMIPKDFTADLYFKLLKDTISFLLEKDIKKPSFEMEFVIGTALASEDINLQIAYKDTVDKIILFEDLRAAIEDYCDKSHLVYSITDIDEVMHYLKDKILEQREEDIADDEEMTDIKYLRFGYNYLFDADSILAYAFDDNDFFFLQYETVAELRNSEMNKELGIISAEEPSMLDDQEENEIDK